MAPKISVPLLIGPRSPILSDKNTVVLDASFLLDADRDAQKEFAERRIRGARFWSLEDVSEPHPQGFKLMLPSPERFAEFAGKHGILPESHVVVYDTNGVFSAPRTVFTFKAYGHEKVSLLDGGLPRAILEEVELEEGEPKPFQTTVYPVPELNKDFIATYEEVQKASASPPSDVAKGVVILDARLPDDFAGSDDDPKTGHIPHAFSLPFRMLVKSPEGYPSLIESEDFIGRLMKTLGPQADDVLSKKRPVITSCSGGLTSAITWLALQNIGINSKLYDESWNGYSQHPDAVIAKA